VAFVPGGGGAGRRRHRAGGQPAGAAGFDHPRADGRAGRRRPGVGHAGPVRRPRQELLPAAPGQPRDRTGPDGPGLPDGQRRLNDTPKIFALLLATRALSPSAGLAAVGLAMAAGGLAGARKVAETMSKKIVPLNTGQGFVANAATAFLVIGASRWGVPVSTT